MARKAKKSKVAKKRKVKPEEHHVRRGKDAVPAAGRHKVTEVMYVPEENGPEMTVVDGIPFRAFEATVVPVDRMNMLATLAQNPFFSTDGKLTPAQKTRMKLWQTKRAHEQKLDDLEKAHKAQMEALRGPVEPTLNTNPPRTS